MLLHCVTKSQLILLSGVPTCRAQAILPQASHHLDAGNKMNHVELDGRTGEGGGQVVRVAIAIAALTGQAVTITNVRGNRDRGGM